MAEIVAYFPKNGKMYADTPSSYQDRLFPRRPEVLCKNSKLDRILSEMRRTITQLANDSWRSLRLRNQALGRLEMGLLLLESVTFEASDQTKLAQLSRTLSVNREALENLLRTPEAPVLFDKIEWQILESLRKLGEESSSKEEGTS